MLYELLIVLLICAILLVVFYMVKELLVLPVQINEDTRLTMVIHASGTGKNLEQTVGGLLWLRNSGKVKFELVLRDEGLTEEGRRLATLLARKDGAITLEEGWQRSLPEKQTWTKEKTSK